MISEEREEYWKILMGTFLVPLVDSPRFRLAISTMLMSLLAHLDWARRMIKGGGLMVAVVVEFSSFSLGSCCCRSENFEMMVVAFGAIWVLDWIERRVISWVEERVVSSKGIFVFLVVVVFLVMVARMEDLTSLVTCCAVRLRSSEVLLRFAASSSHKP